MTAKGDGNGFKGGGYGLPATNVPASPPSHIIRFCVAFMNRANGFYSNHHPVAVYFDNDTAYRNRSSNFNLLGLNGNVGILRNDLAYGGTLTANASGVDDASSSWSLPVTVADDDFQSVDSTGMDAARKPDGSLPDVAFMKLAAGSDLIDKGTDIGLPFAGAAPDLGAFETGLVASGGAGGAGGTSGAGGTAGAGAGGTGVGAAMGGAGGADAAGAGAAAAGGAGGASLLATGGTGGLGGGATGGVPGPVLGGGASGGAAALAPGTASSGAADAPNVSTTGDGGGCSCRIGAGSAPPIGAALFPALLLACAARRRRRSR